MFPLTRVPFWYRFFEPQPLAENVLFPLLVLKGICLLLLEVHFVTFYLGSETQKKFEDLRLSMFG